MKKVVIGIYVALTFLACKKENQKSTKDDLLAGAKSEIEKLIDEKEGWKPLFDGKTFKGWHLYLTDSLPNDEWKVENSIITFEPKIGRTEGGKNIVSDKDFTNFILSLEWKISKGGNSGIFWAVVEDPRYKEAYETGPEIQILDNINYPDPDKKHQAGALYGLIAPTRDVSRIYGEWNKSVIYINYKSNEGKVWLNDITIAEFPIKGEEWNNLIENSKFKDWEGFGKSIKGKIGFQDHGTKVSFRNVRIKEL